MPKHYTIDFCFFEKTYNRKAGFILKRKLLLIIMLLLIFQLSSTSSLRVIDVSTWLNETHYNSEVTLYEFVDFGSRFYDGYFPSNSGIKNASLNFFAHKASHIIFYSVLSLVFLANIPNRKNAFKKAWFFVFLTAIADEINQYMIIGRTGLFLDVILDATASMVTLGIVFLIIKRLEKNEMELKKKNEVIGVVR